MTGKRRAPSGWAHARARLTNTALRVATVDRTRRSAEAFWAEGAPAAEFWPDDGSARRGTGPGATAAADDRVWADETQVIPAVAEDETRELSGLPLRDASGLPLRDEVPADGAPTPSAATRQEAAAARTRDGGGAPAGDEASAARNGDAAADGRGEASTRRYGDPTAGRPVTTPAADDLPRPVYARALLLRNIDPGPLMCFLFFEGAMAAGTVLALLDFVNWWAVVVLPATVAVVVKLNDLVAGSASRRGVGAPVAAAGPDWPDRRQHTRSGDPVKEAHLEWRRGLPSDLRSVRVTREPGDFPDRGRPVELPRDW